MNPEDLSGRSVIGQDSEKIGSVYVGDDTGVPERATVKTGLFGHKERGVGRASHRCRYGGR